MLHYEQEEYLQATTQTTPRRTFVYSRVGPTLCDPGLAEMDIAPASSDCRFNHPPSIVGSRLDLLRGSLFPATTSTKLLTLDRCTIGAGTLSIISRLTDLRELTLKDVGGGGEVGLGFLTRLPGLERLEINNCPELTATMSDALMDLQIRNRLVWGVKNLDDANVRFLNACSCNKSLVLYDPTDLHEMEGHLIDKLSDLRIVGFKETTIPMWVFGLQNLTSLCFDGERLAMSEGMSDSRFPGILHFLDTLRCLTLRCNVDHDLFKTLLKHGLQLETLVLQMTYIPDQLPIDTCANLQVLELSANKELSGDILEKVACLAHLKVLHLEGCLHFSADHLNCLEHLKHLKELCITNSAFGLSACTPLLSLNTLTTLKLCACSGVSFLQLCDIPNLETFCLMYCNGLKNQLPFILDNLPDQLIQFKAMY